MGKGEGRKARTGIGDEVGGVPSTNKERCKRVDVLLLVAVGIARRVGWAGGKTPSVVVGHVRCQTSDCGRLASGAVDLSKERRSRADIGAPSEPSSMAGIKVHSDVREVQLRERVLDTSEVSGLGVGALGDGQVGHQVSDGIRLDYEDDLDVGVGD